MTGELVPFTKPRTYLDACREQGVYQKHEEMLAENADLKSKLANVRQYQTATVIKLADASPDVASFSIEQQRLQMLRRFGQFIGAFSACGLGRDWLPLLRHLIVNTEIPGEGAEALFRAATHSHPSGEVSDVKVP